MMKKLVICFLLLGSISFGQDIRDKVRKGGEKEVGPQVVSPDVSILGFKIGATEDEVIKKKGKPKGYLRLSEKKTACLFDWNTAYLFTDGKLSGVRIGSHLIDHHLDQANGVRFYRPSSWKLDNGINEEMALPEVEKILGDRLSEAGGHSSKYHQVYDEGDSQVHLFFSKRTGQDGDSSFRIHGIMVDKK